MGNVIESAEKIRAVGKSWVIRLPKSFTESNKLAAGTQVLLTVKNGQAVEAEILPPISNELSNIAARILKKRRSAFDELKRLGD